METCGSDRPRRDGKGEEWMDGWMDGRQVAKTRSRVWVGCGTQGGGGVSSVLTSKHRQENWPRIESGS